MWKMCWFSYVRFLFYAWRREEKNETLSVRWLLIRLGKDQFGYLGIMIQKNQPLWDEVLIKAKATYKFHQHLRHRGWFRSAGHPSWQRDRTCSAASGPSRQRGPPDRLSWRSKKHFELVQHCPWKELKVCNLRLEPEPSAGRLWCRWVRRRWHPDSRRPLPQCWHHPERRRSELDPKKSRWIISYQCRSLVECKNSR